MTKDEDFKLLKIQTFVLRVNIHCEGCEQQVKKILQRIEGVYQVKIEAERQRVSVSGNVDSATLVKKLMKSGKHAELCSPKSNQNPNQNTASIKENKKAHVPKNKRNDEQMMKQEDEMQLIRNKINQLSRLKQHATNSNNGKTKKNVAGGCKKGNDQMANANDMSVNDISAMMSLAGFHGNGVLGNGGFGGLERPQHDGFNAGSDAFVSRHGGYQQMLYNRSAFVPPTTGYYYSYGSGGDYAGDDHVFSDENAGGCRVM